MTAPVDRQPAPGPWAALERGRLIGEDGPAFIRILAADGTKVCDVTPHVSAGGPGVEIARINAQWIVEHGPRG